MIRLASQDDLDFLDQNGPFLKRAVLADKIEREEVYVAERDEQLIGFAHYNFFCDIDRILTLINILEALS